MEPFFALFFAMESIFCDDWNPDFDIIGNLPLEVAIIILRKLDPKSLLTAVSVCTKWLSIVKSDRVLRNRVREELARQRREQYMRHMFLSGSVAHHSQFLSEARVSAQPYPDGRKTSRKFQKSLKTVNKASKERKDRTWVSSVSTSNIRKMR